MSYSSECEEALSQTNAELFAHAAFLDEAVADDASQILQSVHEEEEDDMQRALRESLHTASERHSALLMEVQWTRFPT